MSMQLFSKPLTQTDIQKRLAIPTDTLRSHVELPEGDHYKDLLVKDTAGTVWTFRCSTRMTGIHPKPVLSAGWLDFVKNKKLKIKDQVTFYKEYDEATGAEYRIEVKRHIISIMGNHISVDVEGLHHYIS